MGELIKIIVLYCIVRCNRPTGSINTETALIRVVNDIHRAIDDQCESILVLLDLSAALDTIDHAILLERLRFLYGFSNLVLQWFTSYLVNRPQRVVLDKPRRLSCGVPQSSNLGLVLFSLYISPLEDVITAHGLKAMIYADDSQLYIIMRQSNPATASKDLTLCIQDIMSWNVSNIVKCNLKKKLKSFTSRIFHRPNQFLLSRLEIVQFLWVMKSKTSGSHLSAISLLKLTSTTFVAPPHILFITSEKLGTFYLDLLPDVLFTHFFLQNYFKQKHSSRPTLLWVRETTTVAKYSCKANC